MFAAWLDKMPDATQGSATGEALQAIVELDLDGTERHRTAARLWAEIEPTNDSTPAIAPSASLALDPTTRS